MTKMKFTRKFPFLLREQLKSITADSAKGLFSKEPFQPSKDIKTYYDYYESDSVVFAAVNSKANAAVGRGFDTEVDEDTTQNKKAKELVDEFCEHMQVDSLIGNIARNVCIAGFCPVETQIKSSDPKVAALRIIHPKTVYKIEWDKDKTKPVTLVQRLGTEKAEIDFKNLAWFDHNRVGNDPMGTSMLKPVLNYLGYKDSAVKNMDLILQRYASPKGIWKSRGSIKTIRDTVVSSKLGEDLFLGNLPDEELDKIVEFVEVDPRVKFWEYIEYIDRLIYVGLIAPNIFYFKDATEASARVLLEIVDREIYSLARSIKREMEEKWFAPLVKLALGEGVEVPKVKWRQRPAMKDLHLPDLVAAGLEKGFIGFDEYHELMSNLGVTWEKDLSEAKLEYEQREQRKQKWMQQSPFQKKPFGKSEEEEPPLIHGLREGDESYLVTRLGRRGKSGRSDEEDSSTEHSDAR